MSGGTGIGATNKLSVYDYNVKGDAILNPDGTASGTNDGPALNQYFAACRDRQEEWYLPPGDYKVSSGPLTIWTGGRCEGRILVPNNNAGDTDAFRNKIIVSHDVSTDEQEIPLTEVNGWTGATQFSRKIGNSSRKRGQLIIINTDSQKLINRLNNGAVGSLGLGECALVADDTGSLAHSLFTKWDNASWTAKNASGGDNTYQVKIVRHPITIQNLQVVVYSDNSNQHANAIVVNTRPNVVFDSCSIENFSGYMIANGFSDDYTCNVTHRDGWVNGMIPLSVGYGWNSNVSAGLTYVAPRQIYCRRGIDAHKSKNIHIVSPHLPDGWGAHYSWWMGSTGGTLGASTATNPQAVQVAGGGFYARDARVTISQSADAFARVRGDYWECDEQIDLSGSVVDFTTPGTTVYLVDNADMITAFDTGRTTKCPTRINLANMQVTLAGPTNQVLQTVSWSKRYPAAGATGGLPQKYVVDSDWEIDFSVRFINGTDLLPSSTIPRIQMTVCKSSQSVGAGIRARIRNLPCIYVNVSTTSDAVTPAARLSARIENISGITSLLYANGAYKSFVCDTSALTTAVFPGSAGYAAQGDENIIQGDLSKVFATDGSAGFRLANGMPLRVDDVPGMVNSIVLTGGASGTAPKLQAIGSDSNVGLRFATRGTASLGFFTAFTTQQFEITHTAGGANWLYTQGSVSGAPAILGAKGADTNVDLSLVPKGTGTVRFGTRTTTSSAAINGFITIKDAAGNTVKLATIA